MSVEIDPQYKEEIEKSEKESKPPIDSEGAVFSFLDNLRKQALSKEVAEEISFQLKNLEKGETDVVIKFIFEMARNVAEHDYGIKASNPEEIKDRLAEARVGLDEEIQKKQAELIEMNARLEEARSESESESWEVKELELEALRLHKELGELHLKKEDDFSKLQNLVDAISVLEK